MTSAFSNREMFRWLLAAGAVVVASFVALYFSLFVIFGPFPKEFAEPTAGIATGLLVVLAGSLPAPRQRLVTALILFVCVTALAPIFLSFHLLGTLGGGIMAVAFVAWWFHPRRTERSTVWVGIAISAAFFTFIGVGYSYFVDRPARPDTLAPELVEALGTNASVVTAFYSYDRGGFIDHEWLWRIDAAPEAIAALVTGLELRSTNEVPRKFWKMPPHYWPDSMPAGGEAFQSRGFSGDQRGADGSHYFLVHDKAQSRAFVWVKDNF